MSEQNAEQKSAGKQPSDKGADMGGQMDEENQNLIEKPQEEEVDPFHRKIENSEVCCCCICQCSRPETRKLSCCGCFPIKCGIVATGIFTLFLILITFVEIFYFILSDFIHWWYVLVCVLLLVPAIIGACFLVIFFNQDQTSTRSKVRLAYIFVIISFSLIAIWNIVYFNAWYKSGEVVAGGEQTGYYRFSKKQYLFWTIFLTFIIDALYAYFICVIARYKNALQNADAEKEKAEEEKKKQDYENWKSARGK